MEDGEEDRGGRGRKEGEVTGLFDCLSFLGRSREEVVRGR